MRTRLCARARVYAVCSGFVFVLLDYITLCFPRTWHTNRSTFMLPALGAGRSVCAVYCVRVRACMLCSGFVFVLLDYITLCFSRTWHTNRSTFMLPALGAGRSVCAVDCVRVRACMLCVLVSFLFYWTTSRCVVRTGLVSCTKAVATCPATGQFSSQA